MSCLLVRPRVQLSHGMTWHLCCWLCLFGLWQTGMQHLTPQAVTLLTSSGTDCTRLWLHTGCHSLLCEPCTPPPAPLIFPDPSHEPLLFFAPLPGWWLNVGFVFFPFHACYELLEQIILAARSEYNFVSANACLYVILCAKGNFQHLTHLLASTQEYLICLGSLLLCMRCLAVLPELLLWIVDL